MVGGSEHQKGEGKLLENTFVLKMAQLLRGRHAGVTHGLKPAKLMHHKQNLHLVKTLEK